MWTGTCRSSILHVALVVERLTLPSLIAEMGWFYIVKIFRIIA